MLKYTHSNSPKIVSHIIQIHTFKDLFDKLPKLPQLQENLLRKSTLKSSLFSARIEGNTLELAEIEGNALGGNEKKEIFQIFNGLKLARSHAETATKDFVCEIHSIVMDGLTSDLGRFRQEPSAVFNSAGVAIYVAPSPSAVPALMNDLTEYINIEEPDLARVAVGHFAFEKIHPFLDGNGRVGRILMNWHLGRLGFGFSGLASFEEYLENNRERYYSALATETNDITEFVEFILEAVSVSAEKVILELQEKEEGSVEDTLLPRRAEILAVIRDHKMISFDEIRRRFLLVSPRMLHYDLQYLIKKGLVRKLGATKGAVYVPK